MARCEDYPCCGHTPEDPCDRQWYDEPGAFDTSRPGKAHALCDHENGFCDVDDYDADDDDLRIEPARGATYNHDGEFAVYRYDEYPPSSVLAGRERRS